MNAFSGVNSTTDDVLVGADLKGKRASDGCFLLVSAFRQRGPWPESFHHSIPSSRKQRMRRSALVLPLKGRHTD
jgi:hypothetical protein